MLDNTGLCWTVYDNDGVNATTTRRGVYSRVYEKHEKGGGCVLCLTKTALLV